MKIQPLMGKDQMLEMNGNADISKMKYPEIQNDGKEAWRYSTLKNGW